jgi:hypothetical protein
MKSNKTRSLLLIILWFSMIGSIPIHAYIARYRSKGECIDAIKFIRILTIANIEAYFGAPDNATVVPLYIEPGQEPPPGAGKIKTRLLYKEGFILEFDFHDNLASITFTK